MCLLFFRLILSNHFSSCQITSFVCKSIKWKLFVDKYLLIEHKPIIWIKCSRLDYVLFVFNWSVEQMATTLFTKPKLSPWTGFVYWYMVLISKRNIGTAMDRHCRAAIPSWHILQWNAWTSKFTALAVIPILPQRHLPLFWAWFFMVFCWLPPTNTQRHASTFCLIATAC